MNPRATLWWKLLLASILQINARSGGVRLKSPFKVYFHWKDLMLPLVGIIKKFTRHFDAFKFHSSFMVLSSEVYLYWNRLCSSLQEKELKWLSLTHWERIMCQWNELSISISLSTLVAEHLNQTIILIQHEMIDWIIKLFPFV